MSRRLSTLVVFACLLPVLLLAPAVAHGAVLTLNDVVFAQNEGWIACTAGTLLHSTDTGATWKQVKLDTTGDLKAVYFRDKLHGWAWTAGQGNSGPVESFYTSDGGKTWAKTVRWYDDGCAVTAAAGKGTEGYVFGWTYHLHDFGGVYQVAKSHDGGATWTRTSPGGWSEYTDDPKVLVNGAVFRQDGTLWTCGDAGTITGSGSGPSGTTKSLKSISFPDNLRGWVAGEDGVVRKTVNGGATWTSANQIWLGDLTSIWGIGTSVAMVAGTDGSIRRTSDGGADWDSWAEVYPGVNDGVLNKLYFRDSTHGYAVGAAGKLLTSSNAGQSWQLHLPLFATAPQASYLKSMNPIAYELLSLQKTRFYAKIDQTNVWAKLYVKTAAGDKVLYNGAVNAPANTDFWFPWWNGTGVDGQRLPSASYDVVLELTKGGMTSVRTAKILVSRIYFTFSGTSANGAVKTHTGYMIPGNANCYVSGETAQTADRLTIGLSGPNGYSTSVGDWSVPILPDHLSTTGYVRSPNQVRARAVHQFGVTGLKNVLYRASVIQ